MTSPKIIVAKWKLQVGTSALVNSNVLEELEIRGEQLDFHVVSNTEFLKKRSAVADFMKPDRIIIRIGNQTAKSVMHELYDPYNRNHDRFMFMDIRLGGGLTKYDDNACWPQIYFS